LDEIVVGAIGSVVELEVMNVAAEIDVTTDAMRAPERLAALGALRLRLRLRLAAFATLRLRLRLRLAAFATLRLRLRLRLAAYATLRRRVRHNAPLSLESDGRRTTGCLSSPWCRRRVTVRLRGIDGLIGISTLPM